MNIGGYKPDGNIMTVPEIKEIVTEGVDISDLKDKVDTIQTNVTTLNEAVGELKADLQTVTNRLLSELNAIIDTVLISDSYSIVNPIFYGYVAGSATVYSWCDLNKIIDTTKTFNVDVSGVTRMVIHGPTGNKALTQSDISTMLRTIKVDSTTNGKIYLLLSGISDLVAESNITIGVTGTITVTLNE